MYSAFELAAKQVSSNFPPAYATAFERFAKVMHTDADPYKAFHQDLQAILSTVLALLSSLSQPHSQIDALHGAQKAAERHRGSLRRSDRWPLGLLDDTRKGIQFDAMEKMEKAEEQARGIARELRYTQQTVASELAAWQDLHEKMAKRSVRRLALAVVVREKDRLAGMRRAMRVIGESMLQEK